MSNDFRIRFRTEVVPFFKQAFLQFHVVFNDPVVNDDEIAIFIRMGMGIDVRRTAVRCPTGVTDAGRPDDGMFLDFFCQVGQPTRFFANSNSTVMIDGNACRVITAVLQLAQTIH